MAIANADLYPPIIDTYMPAFIKNAGCRIYFSLSPYASLGKSKFAQIKVSNQRTNKSELNNKTYPSEIKFAMVQLDEERTSNDKYYITIDNSDIQGGFQSNTYYKVQIRLSGIAPVGANGILLQKGVDSWLSSNLDSFSEWSTVCLIKGINLPIINLRSFSENVGENEIGTVFAVPSIVVTGNVDFGEDEDEVLKSYSIKIYNNINELILDSGDIYTDQYSSPNQINYPLNINFKEKSSYKMEFTITTKNLYTLTKFYNFAISSEQEEIDDIEGKIIRDEENGRNRISLDIQPSELNKSVNLIIRRASSKDNFTIWNDIHIMQLNITEQAHIDWYDCTIESGIWYKYMIQKADSEGIRLSSLNLTEERAIKNDNGAIIKKVYDQTMMIFDDMFLIANGKQLKIKYNPSVSSMKYTTVDSKTDTIGSKYPFIKRNGSVEYRTFPISGLITFLADENELLTSKQELFKDQEIINQYNNYNLENNITLYNDYIYEREFRKAVAEFLYKDNVKLFKSTPEGNILVKLMDINFTPDESLGRYIYTFSCTAYEIAEDNIENYNNYNIQKIGNITNVSASSSTDIIEKICYITLSEDIYSANTNIQDLIKAQAISYYNKDEYSIYGIEYSLLEFAFTDEGYLINLSNNPPTIATNDDLSNPDYNIITGHLINLQTIAGENLTIAVPATTQLYRLSIDEDNKELMTLSSIAFPQDSKVQITVSCNLILKKNSYNEDTGISTSNMIYSVGISSLFNKEEFLFNPKQDVYQMIKNQIQNDIGTTEIVILEELFALEIISNRDNLIAIKIDDNSFKTIKIGSTDTLNINLSDDSDEYFNITGCYFDGCLLSWNSKITKDTIDIEKFTGSYASGYKYDGYDIEFYKNIYDLDTSKLSDNPINLNEDSFEGIKILKPVAATVNFYYKKGIKEVV